MNALRIGQSLFADLRYALRRLRNAPGYALTSILMLGLGLGATTAMLAVVDSVLLRPVALPHSEQLVTLQRIKGADSQNLGVNDIRALERGAPSIATLAAYNSFPQPITTADGTSVLNVLDATPNYFRAVGVPAHLGRTFTESDGNAPVAVVSNLFWRKVLHSDPHVIGSTIRTEGRVLTIIGVMPSGFTLPILSSYTVCIPHILKDKSKDPTDFLATFALVRLRAGVSPALAEAQARAVFNRISPDAKDGWRLSMAPFGKDLGQGEQSALLALLAACALLLAIACVNSANLQIARGTAQAGEMRVRSALGASRARLLQQIAIESITVSLLGAGFGMAIAAATVRWARAVYGIEFARFDELALHPLVFASCASLAIAVGLLAALAPAVAAGRNASEALNVQANRSTRRSRLSGLLVAAEVALTCVLLATAGLFLRTFNAFEHVPLGFDPHHMTAITLMPVNPAEGVLATKQTSLNVLEKLNRLPGVEAATTQTAIPFGNVGLRLMSSIRFDGHDSAKTDMTSVDLIGPAFARTFGFSMLQGREFNADDVVGAPPVAIVNQAFVHKFPHDARILGRSVDFPPMTNGEPFFRGPFTIIGIMPDQVPGQMAGPAAPTIHLNFAQTPTNVPMSHFVFGVAPEFAVRSDLPQDVLNREIRAALKQTAPEFAEMGILSMEEAAGRALDNQRLALRLASGFGLIALILSAIGIYGVLAYTVAQRTREIGIRMALGSTRAGAVKLVATQAGAMAVVGLAVGLAAAWPAGRAVRSFLFGVQPLDPLSLVATAALLLAVCAAAAAAPAWRATQVDPAEALRAE